MIDGPPRIFDPHALALRRARASRIGGDAFLVHEATQGLAERLSSVQRTFSNALLLESAEASVPILRPLAKRWTREPLQTNDSFAAEPGQFDLIVSVLSLHAVNDLPGVLLQARRALKPDGLFLAALFGADTLLELRESFAAAEIETLGGVSPRVAPFADVRDLGGLLQRAGFALPVADQERTVVRYREFAKLVSDLRAMGETNALAERNRSPLPRMTLAAAIAHYGAHHADADGRLRATFDIAYLTGWAPHESQQKPLRPGSAISRLAVALKTTEHGTGDPAPGATGKPPETGTRR
jgi:SAM-dependent methyltransferase